MAYDDTDLLSNVTTTGWEFSVPLSILGTTGGETYELFALYTNGSGNTVSANTLPEIDGQSGTNLGGNPDFTSIADDQHTGANPLPVELADFRAMPDGASTVLTWRTLSETGNDRFEIEHAAPGEASVSLEPCAGRAPPSKPPTTSSASTTWRRAPTASACVR